MMWSFKHLSTSKRGKPLEAMRKYYISKNLPIITHACPAWFSLESYIRCTISRQQIIALDRLHNECLRQIAQAERGTARIRVQKELEIMPIATILEEKTLIFQARALQDGSLEYLRRWRCTPYKWSRGKCYDKKHLPMLAKEHPYHVHEANARQLLDWAKESGQPLVKVVKKLSLRYVKKLWAEHCSKNEWRKDVPTLWEDWGESFKHYKGLDRRRSTVLFRSRVVQIGLNKSLYSRAVC